MATIKEACQIHLSLPCWDRESLPCGDRESKSKMDEGQESMSTTSKGDTTICKGITSKLGHQTERQLGNLQMDELEEPLWHV